MYFVKAPGAASAKVPAVTIQQGATTADTVRKMQQEIWRGAHSLQVRSIAVPLVRSVPKTDNLWRARKLFEWVKRNVAYVRDPYGIELLHSADHLLGVTNLAQRWGTGFSGDCDDHSILLGSLLMSVGYPVRLTVMSNKPDGKPHHVYPEGMINGRWVPMDTTVDHPMGYAAPATWKRHFEVRRS